MKLRPILLDILAVLIALAICFAIALGIKAEHDIIPTNLPPQHAPVVLHTIYKYSVVPGGVWSVAQAGWSRGQLIVRNRDYAAYVSYKRNGRIFWTRHKVRIPAGEPLLTNGTVTIRMRCGNHVSDAPQVPTEPVDISGELEFADPAAEHIPPTVFRSPLIETASESRLTLYNFPSPGFFVGFSGNGPEPKPKHHPRLPKPPGPLQPILTPEPDGWLLCMSGLALLGLLIYFRRKQ